MGSLLYYIGWSRCFVNSPCVNYILDQSLENNVYVAEVHNIGLEVQNESTHKFSRYWNVLEMSYANET